MNNTQKLAAKLAETKLNQWIDIEVVRGQTILTVYPSNRAIERLRRSMNPPPRHICRHFYFPHGIPREYKWINTPYWHHRWGGRIKHEIPIADWPNLARIEEAYGNQRIFPLPKSA